MRPLRKEEAPVQPSQVGWGELGTVAGAGSEARLLRGCWSQRGPRDGDKAWQDFLRELRIARGHRGPQKGVTWHKDQVRRQKLVKS